MTNITLDSIVQGDSWTQSMTFIWTGHDFTTPLVEVSSRMVSLDECDTYFDFTITPSFTGGQTGQFIAVLSLSGSESDALIPGIWNGDVVVEQPSGYFGPFTAFSYTVDVIPRYTPFN